MLVQYTHKILNCGEDKKDKGQHTVQMYILQLGKIPNFN